MAYHQVIPLYGKYGISVKWNGRSYIFNYAYDEETKAQEICESLAAGFGKPAGEATDIAANYLALSSNQVEVTRLTTRKQNWNVIPKRKTN